MVVEKQYIPKALENKELVSIGRRQGNDILLEDRNVSRQHAQIKREGDNFIIEDLQSTGGTKVNDSKISSQQIFTGDVIKIKEFELHFFSGLKGEEKIIFEEDDRTNFDEDRTKFYEEPLAKLLVKRAENLVIETNTKCAKNEVLWSALGRDRLHTARIE